ncbi:MAG: hypothetical protein HPY78_07060 [Brevinematales bacterium]|nr:hypothetical protein [Brevinematales bacterium]
MMKEFSVKYGQIAPVKEFGGAGGGWQYKLDESLMKECISKTPFLEHETYLQWLLRNDYLKRTYIKGGK